MDANSEARKKNERHRSFTVCFARATSMAAVLLKLIFGLFGKKIYKISKIVKKTLEKRVKIEK